jgi:glycosyltransferase involved in cell wall biosynthesis/predicted O-methyltransferase YrrM
MKKIIFITPHLSTGGLPQYLLKKIEHFLPEFDIYCIEYSNIAPDYVVQKNKLKEILGDKLITLGEDKTQLVQVLMMIEPDVVHFEEIPEHFVDTKILDILYTKERKYNIVVTTHSSTTDPSSIKYTADKFVLVSSWSKNVFDNFYNDSIDCDIFEYPIVSQKFDKISAKEKLGFDNEHIHVLNVGLFTPGKNQGELFHLASLMQQYKIKFHFVGNMASNFEKYWKQILKTKPENCIIHGERSDVELFYQASDAFYFTSNFELNPLVVKESLSYGLPTFIKNLETYNNSYDGIVTYIQPDVNHNIYNIIQQLKPEKSKEIFGWFSYKHLYDFFVEQSSNESIIVEIGSFFGKSTNYLLEKVKKSKKNINVVAIDTFQGSENEQYHLDIVSQYDGDIYQPFTENVDIERLTILKEKSEDACKYFGNGTIDFLMIDGDHSYDGVTNDISNYFYKVKPGGYISGDDYNVFDSTTKAVNDYFLGCHNLSSNGINWFYRIPRVQIVHISTVPMSDRAKKSLANIMHLDKYNFSVKFIQNERYKGDLNLSNYRIEDTSRVNEAHYGCYLAHTQALEEIDEYNFDYTIIMEEDAYLSCTLKEFADAVHKAIFLCETKPVYFIGFGNTSGVDCEDYNEDYYQSWHQNLAHCYMIPNRYKQWYLDKIVNEIWDVSDIWFNHIFHNDRQLRLATKNIYSKQISGVSIIDNVYKQYKNGLMV